MPERPTPDFDNPPVTEVALGIQFADLVGFGTIMMGRLWHENFRADFPETEEHPPISHAVEKFEGPGKAGFQIQVGPAPVRFWFLNRDKTELVQVQRNRFVFNWRQRGTPAEYPRYPIVKEKFLKYLRAFTAFIESEKLGTLVPDQCEVDYVNEIAAGEGFGGHGEPEKVLSICGSANGEFLQPAEGAHVQFRYAIRQREDGPPVGRLHVNLSPRFRTADKTPIYFLHLMARGAPLGEGVEGVEAFLDLGREWVVRGFADVTTGAMHKVWRRKT